MGDGGGGRWCLLAVKSYPSVSSLLCKLLLIFLLHLHQTSHPLGLPSCLSAQTSGQVSSGLDSLRGHLRGWLGHTRPMQRANQVQRGPQHVFQQR